ncbi:hypothetical protein DFJ74DRAFT_774890 [Hyaloraphidium curvatum]|nr:hypothetical protein DFJ74DRAFT_774890 [Hyaloraphidium curvatum]
MGSPLSPSSPTWGAPRGWRLLQRSAVFAWLGLACALVLLAREWAANGDCPGCARWGRAALEERGARPPALLPQTPSPSATRSPSRSPSPPAPPGATPSPSAPPGTTPSPPGVVDPHFAPLAAALSRLGPPQPSCFVGPPAPRRFDTVLVVAQGRSGSTSLLRLLNTLPCYNIRGENPEIFSFLLGAPAPRPRTPPPARTEPPETPPVARSFRDAAAQLAPFSPADLPWSDEPKVKPSWFNRVDLGRTDAALRLLAGEVLQHVPGRVTSGFKSITLFSGKPFDYAASLAFLDDWIRLFPRTAVVFITREGAERSGWWRQTRNAAGLLRQQKAGFARFAGEVRSGRYRHVAGADVRVAHVDYGGLVRCDGGNGTALGGMYAALGEAFDAKKCAGVMGRNVEDFGVAMSDNDYQPVQSASGWNYGFRHFPVAGAQPVPRPTFGRFLPASSLRPAVSPSDPAEFHASPWSTPPLSIGRALHHPALSPGRRTAAVPCRKWRAGAEMDAEAEVRVPPLLPACGTHAHAGYDFHLLVDGRHLLTKRFALGTEGGTFRAAVRVRSGTEVELCPAPVIPGKRRGDADHGICQPAVAVLALLDRERALSAAAADAERMRARFLGVVVDAGVVRTLLVTALTVGVALFGILRGWVTVTLESVCNTA